MNPTEQETPAQERPSNAIFTCVFKGFDSSSLWFPPFASQATGLTPDFFQAAVDARERAAQMIFAGCAMAKAKRPELAGELDKLAAGAPDLDFFELPERPGLLGWLRLTFDAKGSSPEALAACEQALASAGAPLSVAEAPRSTRLGAFAGGDSDDLPSAFVSSLREATGAIAQRFLSQPASLAAAEAVVLESSDGSKRLVAIMPSSASAKANLAELATFAKFAQACIEAQRANLQVDGAQEFFAPMIQALGGSVGEMSKRVAVGLPENAFFSTPASLHMTQIKGLPSKNFDALAKSFLEGLARRFGAIAASSKGLQGDPQILNIAQLAELSPMFSRLPAAAKAAPEQPKPSAPAP